MSGVEDETAERVDDWAPPPWRSWWSRVAERVAAPVRPWVTWFGPRRLVGGGVTIVLAVGVGWWLVRPAAPPTEARLPYATTTSTAATTGTTAVAAAVTTSTALVPTVIVVHVAGAVVTPAVIELAAGSRGADAVAQVGGALPEADLAAVNLAAVLEDGQQLYVPLVGEERSPIAAPAPASASALPAGPINLNRATAAELDELPGVGPATAAAIVTHRDTNGPFASVDDLEAVRGIGPAKLEALRPLVTT